MWCLQHFDFKMCFAPQQHALFNHLNFQKCSEHMLLLAFWLRNVLRATTPCFFIISTSKSAPNVRCFCILTSKRASRHNGVQLFISHLSRWLRTRRFSEPTFRPWEPQNIGKTQCFATFLPFRALWSSFFWLFLFSDLLSSRLFSDSSHLFFSSVHIVGSLTSKLPWTTTTTATTTLDCNYNNYYYNDHGTTTTTTPHYARHCTTLHYTTLYYTTVDYTTPYHTTRHRTTFSSLWWGDHCSHCNHTTNGYESKLCMERSALFRTYGTKGFRNWSCSGRLECDEV